MKMILADDEPVITRGIQKLVNWESLGIEIVGEYEDGKRALEGIIRLKPDLALLDISMPSMTGIDIIKELKAMGCTTKVIFISGFQDFEYAKNAIKYGALDYLLKPVIEEELLNAVEKCLSKGPIEKNKNEPKADENEQKEADYSKLIEVEDTFYVPIYAKVLYDKKENEQLQKLIRFSFISFLEEYLDERHIGITFTKNENIVIILKGLDYNTCQSVIEEMQKKATKATNHSSVFVIGDKVHHMADIPESFEKCLKLKGYFFFAEYLDRWVFTTKDVFFSHSSDSDRLSILREKVLESVISQDFTNFHSAFEQFAKIICKIADGRKEDAAFYFCNALRLMEEKVLTLNLDGLKFDMKMLLEEGRNTNNYVSMIEVYQDIFIKYLNMIQQSVVSNEKRDIQKAKDYIEKHYKDNLTLHVLSEVIHMNPYYFSSFFKKNAGENFKDYVNRVRIQHAVSLLLSSDLKTYEIANEVGFSDARAFSEIFQRFYHETPNAYRKRISAREGNV